MSRTIEEQIQSGVKLAGGIVLFAVCILLLTYGLDAVWPDVRSGHSGWLTWIGWVELLSAFVLIPLTMHLWLQFFAGCSLFGVLNGIWAAVIGRSWHSPHTPISRFEAIEITLFFLAALVWSFRFAKEPPTIADRIAITLYILLVFVPPNHGHFTMWDVWGPFALLA